MDGFLAMPAVLVRRPRALAIGLLCLATASTCIYDDSRLRPQPGAQGPVLDSSSADIAVGLDAIDVALSSQTADSLVDWHAIDRSEEPDLAQDLSIVSDAFGGDLAEPDRPLSDDVRDLARFDGQGPSDRGLDDAPNGLDSGLDACAQGTCARACSPGQEVRCSGTTPQTCSSDGTWVSGTPCAGGCVNGACTPCMPAQQKGCGGNCNEGVMTCDTSGNWGTCVQPGPPVTYYPDVDLDGQGDNTSTGVVSCHGAPAGHVTNRDDCDDSNPDVYLGQVRWFDKQTLKGSWDYDCSNSSEREPHNDCCTCLSCSKSQTGACAPDAQCGDTIRISIQCGSYSYGGYSCGCSGTSLGDAQVQRCH